MIRPLSLLRRRVAVAAALLAISAAAHAVGRAEVRFADPRTYTDAGFGAVEIERTQRGLAAHFDRLARRLPDGQVLQVELQDIDLAGELDMLVVDPVRVLGRLPDSPRLALSYQLRAGEQVLLRGDEVLTDLGYLYRSGLRHRGEPLAYERRLLDEWFAQRVAPQSRHAP